MSDGSRSYRIACTGPFRYRPPPQTHMPCRPLESHESRTNTGEGRVMVVTLACHNAREHMSLLPYFRLLTILSYSFNECIFLWESPIAFFDVVLHEVGNHLPVRSFVHRPYAPAKVRPDGVSDPLLEFFLTPIQVVIHRRHLMNHCIAVTPID